jgi:hypothetical protein
MQQICIINAWNERVKDSDNFGARMAKIGVVVEIYGKNNFENLFVISRKWLGVYMELFSKIQGSSWNFVDCGLILNKNRGISTKWRGIIGFELFSNGRRHGLGPRLMDHRRCRSMVDRG